MDAICIQVKQWLFLNSTSFIQMNDGPWYSVPCGNINIHQRPATLTKSGNHQHLLFKMTNSSCTRGTRRGHTAEKVDKPIQISIRQRHRPLNKQCNEKRQFHWSGMHTPTAAQCHFQSAQLHITLKHV